MASPIDRPNGAWLDWLLQDPRLQEDTWNVACGTVETRYSTRLSDWTDGRTLDPRRMMTTITDCSAVKVFHTWQVVLTIIAS